METTKRDERGKFISATGATGPKQRSGNGAKNCRRYAKREVVAAWPEIVKILLKNAMDGSYNHAKLLVELSGIKNEGVKSVKRRESSSVAKMLLEKLAEMDKPA